MSPGLKHYYTEMTSFLSTLIAEILLKNIVLPVIILMSYVMAAYRALSGLFTRSIAEKKVASDKDSDTSEESPIENIYEDFSMDSSNGSPKMEQQEKSLLERMNDDLLDANRQWSEKYEELYTKNRELTKHLRQEQMMLCSAGGIGLLMLSSYAMVIYTNILAKGPVA